MSAKIQIKSDMVGTFGGIFLMIDHFNKVGLDILVDKLLGNRRFNAKYSYSDISKTLLATYVTNGSCIEDSKQISDQISEKSQGYRLCSPDVLLNSFKELSTESTASRSESGIGYKFNYNPALTDLPSKVSSNADKSTRIPPTSSTTTTFRRSECQPSLIGWLSRRKDSKKPVHSHREV